MLKLNNIYKRFNDEIIFEDLNITLELGFIYGLLGSNGSGKSTLAKILLGLESFDQGSVQLDVDGISLHTLQDIKKYLYYVFQNPDHQIVGTIVSDDVAFGVENICTDHCQIVNRVQEALAAVDLVEFQNVNPLMLSGGQKQRLAIAGALAVRAKFIILDEPSAMLDPDARVELWALLKNLKSQGFCILVITHLSEEIRQCDFLYTMSNHRLEYFSDITSFFNDGHCKLNGIEDDDLSMIHTSGLERFCD